MAYRAMMKATISTHNGHTTNRGHNIRNPKTVKNQKHIYPEGTVKPNGRIAHFEVWKDETIKHAYHGLFDKAQADYNANQKRADRRIEDYYTQVKNDKTQHVAYEMIIGVYNEDLSDDECKDILKTFVDEWDVRNPNLYMAGAYYHADEEGKSPHVHITYIPVAHDYKKGMETQAGLVKALGEQGYWTSSRKLTAQICWEAHENRVLEAICNEHGIEVEHPREAGRKHLETQEYKARERIKQAEREVNTVDKVITAKNSKIEAQEAQIQRNKAMVKISRKHVVISKDAYTEYNVNKRLYETADLRMQEAQRKEKEVQQREQQQAEQQRQIEMQWQQLEQQRQMQEQLQFLLDSRCRQQVNNDIVAEIDSICRKPEEQRIEVANNIHAYEKHLEQNIYDSLTYRLLHDSNVNVRIAMAHQGFVVELSKDHSAKVREACNDYLTAHAGYKNVTLEQANDILNGKRTDGDPDPGDLL